MEKQTTRTKFASPEHHTTTMCHQPCENGCGFFGSPETKNLCSLCSKEYHLVKEKTTLPRIKVKTSNNSNPSCNVHHSVRLMDEFLQSSDGGAGYSYDDDQKNKHCHYFCNKKIRLFEFRCRCGGRFCQVHRFPEEHACKYDYTAAGREDFLKENPICKPDKLKTRV